MSLVLERIGAFSSLNEELTVNQKKQILIQTGIIPTSESAKKVFWSLGEDWWRQIIDGKCQKYGKWVFDQGLHGWHTEPGYLNGVEKASQYFIENLDQELNLDLYKRVHHIACEHFQGQKNDTGCNSGQIDHFRVKEEACTSPIHDARFLQLQNKKRELISKQRAIERYEELINPSPQDEFTAMFDQILIGIQETPEEKKDKIQKNFSGAKKWIEETFNIPCESMSVQEIYEFTEKQLDILHEEMTSFAKSQADILEKEFSLREQQLNLTKSFVECFPTSDFHIRICYLPSNQSEAITIKSIEKFNKNLIDLRETIYSKIQLSDEQEPSFLASLKEKYQERVILLIAELYAELEWEHPWIDGQGRTDLIVLNGLLCREGLNPCILKEPYFSTGSTVEDWTSYLKQGIKRFNEIKNR